MLGRFMAGRLEKYGIRKQFQILEAIMNIKIFPLNIHSIGGYRTIFVHFLTVVVLVVVARQGANEVQNYFL